MKLTEEVYTDLVQKRLKYKLTFDDYCRLEEDKWIKTYFEFLSIEMVNTPEKGWKINGNTIIYITKPLQSPLHL